MLVYIGNGFLPGVPARDLTAEEVEKYGGESYLLDTGLYTKPGKAQTKSAKPKQQDEKEGE